MLTIFDFYKLLPQRYSIHAYLIFLYMHFVIIDFQDLKEIQKIWKKTTKTNKKPC